MPQYTPTYKLGYFKRGSSYGETTDYRRFVSLDYNLESYTGIVGVGVINGWTIEQIGPLKVQILPGSGMINGYYSESEYAFKQRSSMISGEREIEIVQDDDIPVEPLVNPYRTNYITYRQEYDPNYNPAPTDIISNYYIKAITPFVIDLPDDSDKYIIAQRNFEDPVNACVNYPSVGDKPLSSSYGNYSEFMAALTAYNIRLATMQAYQWRTYLENHFTSVNFTLADSYVRNSGRVLIGKVVTRLGSIKKIDITQVDSLENLQATIKEQAKPYIAGHIHGGDGPFDPPKINLSTDIRRCALYSYNSTGQVYAFDILEHTETSINVGHKHTYKIDGNGNGYTVEIIGTDQIHFHKINNFIVGNQEYTTATIQTHDHIIPSTQEFIDLDSTYVVYINGVPATSDVTVDLVNRKIIIHGLIGEVYRTYSTSFDVSIVNDGLSSYAFEKSTPSVLTFMMNMIYDFNTTYTLTELIPTHTTVTGGQIGETPSFETNLTDDFSRHPFLFNAPSGEGIAGFEDLRSQSSIAQTLLTNVGDQYTFTPNAARNITITVEGNQENITTSIYEVKIELFGNTEVTGVLKEENIAFINAEKFKMGIFDIARIPPLNHMGRMGEEFLPFQYPLVSTDGIKYAVSPAITTVEQDHYHRLALSESLSGVTHNTYVSEDPIYYAYSNNISYLIAHTHAVSDGNVISTTARDLGAWEYALHGSNAAPTHTHSIIQSIKGDPKIIYSIAETSNGSILAGTSSGLYIIPNDNAYLFVINEVSIYQIGNDLWDLLLKAKAEYELKTSKELVVTEALYLSKINEAYESLEVDGDSILMLGYIDPVRGQDQIMLQKTDSFLLPNFKYTRTKLLNQIEDDETVIDIKLVYSDGTVVTQADIVEALTEESGANALENETVELTTIEKDLHGIPIWTIITDSNGEVFVCGATEYSKNSNIESNLYVDWSYASKPNCASSLKKAYKDSQNNVWIPTEKGLLVSRHYQNAYIIESTNNVEFSVNVNDIVEGATGKIYVANDLGVSLSNDYGKTWYEVLSVNGGCVKIMKDNIYGRIYAITKNFEIYATDNGVDWNSIGSMISQETGDVIVFNGYCYACTANGLYRINVSEMGSWEKVLDEQAYSLGILQDNNGILVGCNQSIYVTMNGTTYIKIADIGGSAAPSLYTQDAKAYYNYAYGNKRQQFFFKELTYTEDPSSSLVDFNIWMAKEGTWNSNALCDIYINRQLIYSSKRNIDKRVDSNYIFSINPSQGILNFGTQTTLTEATEIFSEYISVADSSGFGVGDRIYVVCSENLPVRPVKPDDISGVLQYFQDLIRYYNDKTELENMYFYAEVSGISSGRIFLDRNIDKIVNMLANVYKIPNLSGSTSIFANIYDSPLSNIGTNTHEDLDDKTTYISDNRPYQLNNTYLSDLLQLTQAVKYAFPNIDDYMINTKLFDFRYSWNPNDPNLPYIGDIIDLYSSEAYNEGLYDSEFVSSKSKMVNKILIGHGIFNDMIIVGTDIGIFYAKLTESLEANWFYTYNLTIPVYDLIISNENRLLAATSNGLYESTDIINWTKTNQPSISFPVYTLSYRWTGRETVEIGPHTATFASNVNGHGKITTGIPLYGAIQTNRIITVSNVSSEKNGDYSVISASDYEIIISEIFEGSDITSTTAVIKMGAWWEYLSGDVSPDNERIKNTLMAGGRSMIAFATNVSSNISSNQIIWRQSELPSGISNFSTSDICSLTSGSVLSSIASTTDNEENNLLVCSGSGSNWSKFKDFKAVKGTISGKEATDMGHTTLKVLYTYPSNYISEDYSLNFREIGFFNGNTLLLKTYVYSNETRRELQYITVYGQNIIDIINSNPNLTFIVYPLKINKIFEIDNKNVFYGTNQGLYSDDGSVVNFAEKHGSISKVGNGGIVTKIDVEGTIISVSIDSASNQVILNIRTNDSITNNQLVDNELYITDLSIPINHKVLLNSSQGTTGEITVKLDTAFNTMWNAYVGKKVTIISTKSKIYVTFDSPISTNQFNDGKIYISSNENENIGKSYDIESNTTSYIILKTAIIPRSTFSMNNDSLIIGQTIKIIDSTNRIKLYVIFDDDTELNQFAGYGFRIEETVGTTTNANIANIANQTLSIYSNTSYEIILNPIIDQQDILPPILEFETSSRFAISGNRFISVESFNNKVLSISSDHYHMTNLIGQKLKGTINSISQNGSAYMDITIINPDGFNNPVLLSDGTIIENCKVILYNPLNMAYSYETSIMSYIGGILKLRVYNPNIWNISSYSESKISPTWNFTIESKYSGLSNGTYYQDFHVIIRHLVSDLIEGDTYIFVSSTSGINGDKIEIFDDNGRSFITNVSNVIDSQKMQISSASDNTFLVKDNAGIKVLRNSFLNNHVHRIKNTQVETLSVQDYLDLEYPSVHSHRLFPYISDVSDLVMYNNKFFAVGSGEFVYVSYNNGNSWKQMVDLNKSLEWDEEITGISRIITYGDQIIAGTTNGQIFSNISKGWQDISLEEPL